MTTEREINTNDLLRVQSAICTDTVRCGPVAGSLWSAVVISNADAPVLSARGCSIERTQNSVPGNECFCDLPTTADDVTSGYEA